MSRQTGIKRPFQTHQFAGGVLVSILILAPLLVGGVPQWVQLMMASLSTLGFGALLVSRTYRKQRMRAGMVVKLFVAMIALALVQLIPLPVSILEWVSPVTGGFAGEIATALNTPDAFFSISLHPFQTSFAALRYLTLLFVFILVVERVRESEKEGDALEAGVLILGAIVATLTVVQTLLKSGPMLGGYEPGAHWQARRVVSTFINENHQAAFFNLLTFVAFDSAFRAFGYRKRALYGFLGWGFAGLSLASGSRAGWWALLVGGIVYFVVQNKASFMRKHPRHFWGLLLGTLVGSAGLITLADSLLELGWIEGPDGKWNSKLQGILVAAQSIPAFWFTGMGADAFGEGAGLMNEGLPNLYLTHVENSPLQFLMNFGLLPGAALLWGWIRVGKRVCWAGVKDLEHPGIVIGILVVVLQNMADFSLSTLGVGIPVVVLLGCLEGKAVATSSVRPSRGIPRNATVALALVGIVMLGAVSARYWSSEESSWDRVMTQRLSAVASEDVTRLDERRKTHFLSRPADGYAMILESEHRRRDGNLKEARHWMDMALRRIPHQLNVHFANSLLLVSEGQSTEASVLMRELFTTNWPSREKIANQLVGLLRSNEGRKWSPMERVEFLEQALPLENDAILSVGTLMVQKGFEELYVGALEKRLNQEPDNSEIRHAFVAQLMSREKWSERAAREMTQLIARDGKSAKALQLQGMLFERESKPLQAWAMYAEAISLDPRYVRALLGEVRLRMQLGRGSVGEGREAIGAIRSLLGNDYRLTAEYHRVLSIAAELEGEVDECLMEMRMAVRARPDGAGYWKRAIAIAETNGRTLEALQIAEQWSGRMDSNHAEAREVLKRLRNANP